MDRKRQLIEELISHLDLSQGADLGALVAEHKKASEPEAVIVAKESGVLAPEGEGDIEASPDVASAQVDAEGEQMTDDELAELLRGLL